MPVLWRVRELAEQQEITTITQLAAAVGVAYDTAADLWHARARRIDLGTLERVCIALNCTPGDLLVLSNERIASSNDRGA
jgi:putative transcriptional regulator